MADQKISRKLAVIVHADVVGSTALVQRNETLAHERIRDVFDRFSKTIEVYGGIPHELRGDALVAEFGRASDAVAAALAFQARNAQFNTRTTKMHLEHRGLTRRSTRPAAPARELGR